MLEDHPHSFTGTAVQQPLPYLGDEKSLSRPREILAVPRRVETPILALVHAFLPTGGLAWAGDLESMFMLRSSGSVKDLSDAIARRQVVHIQWQGQTWLPVFQFDLIRMQTRAAVSHVLTELTSIYDDWEVADWFSRANPWLQGQSPAQTLLQDSRAVINAASAEVFVVRG